jgi:hypothetical protein
MSHRRDSINFFTKMLQIHFSIPSSRLHPRQTDSLACLTCSTSGSLDWPAIPQWMRSCDIDLHSNEGVLSALGSSRAAEGLGGCGRDLERGRQADFVRKHPITHNSGSTIYIGATKTYEYLNS